MFKGCVGTVFTHGVQKWVRVGRWQEKPCPGCTSETLTRKIFILGRDIGWGGGCRYAPLCCDIDYTFDLAVVTLTYKTLSGLYLGNCKV